MSSALVTVVSDTASVCSDTAGLSVLQHDTEQIKAYKVLSDLKSKQTAQEHAMRECIRESVYCKQFEVVDGKRQCTRVDSDCRKLAKKYIAAAASASTDVIPTSHVALKTLTAYNQAMALKASDLSESTLLWISYMKSLKEPGNDEQPKEETPKTEPAEQLLIELDDGKNKLMDKSIDN